ncbi:ABC transporter permease [Falsirhodobacter halotolerans]|uniref:ABC transporter permease n=1 Tax=Falsirhodobacter halotolerans TaxID=1146892 RepID=UPI001FD22207|nr:ABC transporter permease subunit [Falsirhodobacter halotolerans]MCJ8140647.1 ABC transporter permease subunit [Falsirhodobacter halotolerans]
MAAKRALTPLVLLGLWEVVGRLRLVADGALPAPSLIAARFWEDRADYPLHVWATFQGAGAGFLIGNLIAVAAGILFALSPAAARLARGVNIAIFALPAIAIAPLLTLMTTGMTPRITLAAIGCYFVTMTATVTGITQADARMRDVIRAYGGGRISALRLVELRAALPQILAALRIAAPAAVLGSILAEFGGGGRFGLGAYLIGSLGRADPARLWGIGLAATLMAGAGYALFAWASHRVTASTRAVTVPASPPPGITRGPMWQRATLAAGSIALPFLIWWGLIVASGAPAMIAKTPAALVDYLILAPTADSAQARVLAALGQTLPITALGIAAGLIFAFALAMASVLRPAIVRAFMPIALVTQTMPLVALTPLLVLILGRGPSVILWITISVTFFPAFVTLAQGLQMVSRSALDLSRAYGGGAWRTLRLISLPASAPYAFVALRLAVPRALLGVMTAEWLATGTGLGNLLNQSRGYLDYGMIWTVAVLSVLLSVLSYQVLVWIERRVLARLGMAQAA